MATWVTSIEPQINKPQINKHPDKYQRSYIKTLNHPALINYDLLDNSTTTSNPICIIDLVDYKYIVIDRSIFIKSDICNIEFPYNMDQFIKLESKDYNQISKIIDWVRYVFNMPWGENKQKTIIKYTYPTI